MAVVATTFVAHADHETHDRLEAEVEGRLSAFGGPPEGLMAHIAYPCDGGLMTVDSFRSEQTCNAFIDDVLDPALSAVGMSATSRQVVSLWSFACP